jgi:predicted nucleotidyltransferase
MIPKIRSCTRASSHQRHRLESFPQTGYLLCMDSGALTRDAAIRRLQSIETEIRRLGVRRLALFGSVLRNEARHDSDVDVLVEFEPAEKTFDRFVELAELLEKALQHPVELVTTEALSPFIGPRILAEATDVVRAA